MKFLIASDLHGSAFYCKQLLTAMEHEKADRLILLGDILYHGPRNDLPLEYAPKEVIQMLNPLADRIFCVRGNCDAHVDQMVLSFPILAEYCLLCEKGKTIFVTHGHQYNKQAMPPLAAGSILLHGHTHVPAWEAVGDVMYLNPGSLSISKENSPHSYMTLEDGLFVWKTLQGEEFHRLSL